MADEAPETIPTETTVEFAKSISLGGVTYDKLVVREPTVAEWAKWDGLVGVEANIKALSIVCAIPEAAIKQMGVGDFNAATKALTAFFA